MRGSVSNTLVWALACALAGLTSAPAWAQPAPAEAAAAPPAGMEDTGLRAAPTAARDQLAGALGKIITPYVVIAGGLRFERLDLRTGQTTQARQGVTVAVSRFGFRGQVGRYISFASELEANIGGALGNGASVWEGQAQMSVRDQFIQYQRGGFLAAVGRVTDYATLDFVSAHVADLLLADQYTRDPLLYSGANRGNGLLARYRPVPGSGLELGLAVHSTNPTAITGTLVIGGELFPYSRPFYLAAAQVGRNEFTLPDQNLHLYMATPSVTYTAGMFEAKAAAQFYALDTNMATDVDQPIYGNNFRASVKLDYVLGGGAHLAPFVNLARSENDVLDAMDATVKLADTYTARTLSAGLDYNTAAGHGVGVQYARIRQDAPGLQAIFDDYVNLGATYWIDAGVSVGARVGWWRRDDRNQSETYGHSSLFLTSRLIL
ncbi:hypothetical protein [Haliangium sp.]|uniref:hypothetical protein n=1 Tax=Haliangium sp. TaxID=2663208 RepID=UPI003D0EB296